MSADEGNVDDQDIAFLRRFVAAESSRPEHVEDAAELLEKDAMRERLAATLGIAMMATTSAAAPLAAETVTREVAKSVACPMWIKAALLLGVGFGAGFGARGVLTPTVPSGHSAASTSAMAVSLPSALPAPIAQASPVVTETIDIANLPKVPGPADPTVATAKTGVAKVVAGDAEAERLLLETARVAMRRGDREGALRLLQEHRAKFPQGQLREERDGLMVSALSLLGRTDEASKAAARFRKDYPMSLQGAAMPEPAHSAP